MYLPALYAGDPAPRDLQLSVRVSVNEYMSLSLTVTEWHAGDPALRDLQLSVRVRVSG